MIMDQENTCHCHIKKAGALKIYKTICMYVGLIALGFTAGICGPTLVHMEYILDTDTQGVGLGSIGLNLGYLLGSVLCGVIFHRFNQEIQLSVACVWIALTIGSLPFLPDVYWFYALTAIQNIGCGFLYSSSQYYIINLWINHSFEKPFIQGIHAFWSIGSFSIPFILIPFLPDLPKAVLPLNHADTIICYNGPNMTYIGRDTFKNVTAHNKDHANQMTTLSDSDKMLVKYGYITVGAACILPAIMFLIVIPLTKCMSEPKPKSTVIEQEIQHHENLALKSQSDKANEIHEEEDSLITYPPSVKYLEYMMLVLLFTYTVFVFCQDYVIGLFLSAIAIHGLNWNVTQASILTSVYRGTQGLGRIIGVFISAFLSPTKMLLVNMISSCISLLGFILSVYFTRSDIPVWLLVAGIGISLSTILPCIYLWGAQYVEVTPAYGGMYFAASSVGSIIGSALGSYLFQHHGYMWIMYNALGSSVIVLIIFLIAALSGRKLLRMKKYVTETKSDS